MSKQTWALVDLENIGSQLREIVLTSYSKVFIFVGAKQNTLSLQGIAVDKLVDFTIMKIKEISANNLDFHISYYLGKFDALEKKEIDFVVISNDKGYDNLINHISYHGRKCIRIGNTTNIKNELNTDEKKIIVKIINTDYKKLPKTELSLKNVIKSHLKEKANKNTIDKVYKLLIKHQLIKSRILDKEPA